MFQFTYNFTSSVSVTTKREGWGDGSFVIGLDYEPKLRRMSSLESFPERTVVTPSLTLCPTTLSVLQLVEGPCIPLKGLRTLVLYHFSYAETWSLVYTGLTPKPRSLWVETLNVQYTGTASREGKDMKLNELIFYLSMTQHTNFLIWSL